MAYAINLMTLPLTRGALDGPPIPGTGGAVTICKRFPCALPPGAPRSGFLYKLFTAFGTGDGDGAFAPGDAHLLAAAGTVKIPVIPVPEPLEKHQKFPVFLVSPVGVPGKGAENCQKQQNVG